MTNTSVPRRLLSVRLGLLLIVVVLVTAYGMLWVWMNLGGGVWRGEVGVRRAELVSPNRLALIVHSCNGNPVVSLLRETDVDVLVKVVGSSTPLLGGQECLDILEVELQQPLGNRIVVDKHTGQTVPVSIVNSSMARRSQPKEAL